MLLFGGSLFGCVCRSVLPVVSFVLSVVSFVPSRLFGRFLFAVLVFRVPPPFGGVFSFASRRGTCVGLLFGVGVRRAGVCV